jgi:DNA-binding transcriptional MerR regulator
MSSVPPIFRPSGARFAQPLDLELDFNLYGRDMQELLISELAARTGFSAPTLRYYERIGLLTRPRRTDGGYRVYEDRAIELLQFVSRAKSLGLTLDETRELAALWSNDECQPVQARLTELLHDKLASARTQIAELEAFVGQLESVSGQLGRHVPDGPCDDGCGCTTDAAPLASTPIACTLNADEIGPRLDEWRTLLAHTRDVRMLDDGARVLFENTIDAAQVAALVQSEQTCCSFLWFGVVVDRDGVALEIHGPPDARAVIEALTGLAA